jgi:chemotaxis protein CheZ
MIDKSNLQSLPPEELYKQIEELYRSFQEMQKDVRGIIATGKVPDSAMQLQDVLKSTEDATNTILDCATAINGLSETLGSPEIAAHVTKIYEACTFQDLTGQRIKKVLNYLDALEGRLNKLATTARDYFGFTEDAPKEDLNAGLLNGPQLSDVAPNQDDIDKLFSSL